MEIPSLYAFSGHFFSFVPDSRLVLHRLYKNQILPIFSPVLLSARRFYLHKYTVYAVSVSTIPFICRDSFVLAQCCRLNRVLSLLLSPAQTASLGRLGLVDE